MKTVEMPITSNNVYNVTLEYDVIGVDEVMVVAYGTSKRSSFTGSAQTVKSDELVGTSTSESIDKMLVGKVSGVRVSSTTGAPGCRWGSSNSGDWFYQCINNSVVCNRWNTF
jgi:hypothetical protein